MSILRQNYLYVKTYLSSIKKARQIAISSLAIYERYTELILNWAGEHPFADASKIKPSFPEYLDNYADENNVYLQKRLNECCRIARNFFSFCREEHPKIFCNVKKSWVDSIKPIKRTAKSSKVQYYTLDEMKSICAVQPVSLPQKRIRAAAAFLYLSGMRIRAFLTLPIDCFNINTLRVYQYPDHGVYTKLNKSAVTSLYGIPYLLDIVREWDHFVRSNCPLNTTWYVNLAGKSKISPKQPPMGKRDETYFPAFNPYKQFLVDLHELCDAARIEYKSPHAFRHGHTHYGLSHCETLEEMKAVSQNLMHGSVEITDKIYSKLTEDDMNKTISTLGVEPSPESIAWPIVNPRMQTWNETLSSDEKKVLLRELFG